PARVLRKPLQLEAHLLALISARPEAAANIDPSLLDEDELPTFSELVRFFAEDSRRTWGQANAYFADTAHASKLSDALQNPLYKQAEDPDVHVEEEIAAAVGRLRNERMGRRSDELLRLIVSEEATEADKAEYQDLHVRLARSKAGSPPTEERSEF